MTTIFSREVEQPYEDGKSDKIIIAARDRNGVSVRNVDPQYVHISREKFMGGIETLTLHTEEAFNEFIEALQDVGEWAFKKRSEPETKTLVAVNRSDLSTYLVKVEKIEANGNVWGEYKVLGTEDGPFSTSSYVRGLFYPQTYTFVEKNED